MIAYGTCELPNSSAKRLNIRTRSDVVAVRDGVSMEFHQALSVAITHQDHLAVFQFHGMGRADAAPWCLVSDRVIEPPHPAYAVVLTDDQGRIVFRETLRFEPATDDQPGPHGLLLVQPDAETAPKLAQLAALLTDRSVCVTDEMAPELDGLREALGGSRRVRSLLPMLSQAAEHMTPEAVAGMLRRTAGGLGRHSDRVRRARCLRLASLWAQRRTRR